VKGALQVTHNRDQYIVEALRLTREMLGLAELGEGSAADDGCRILFGEIRDCAYKIRAHAERERDAHHGEQMNVSDDSEGPGNADRQRGPFTRGEKEKG